MSSVLLEPLSSMCRHIYDAVRPLFILSKILGFALFSIENKTFKVIFTKLDAVLVTLHVTILLLLNFVYWETRFLVEIYTSEIMRCFFPAFSYASYSIFSCAKVWIFAQRQKFGRLLQLIYDIDNDLESLGFHFNYVQQRRVVNLILIALNLVHMLLTFACYLSAEYYGLRVDIKVFLFASWGFLANYILVSQFLTSVCLLRERYKAVNKIIV